MSGDQREGKKEFGTWTCKRQWVKTVGAQGKAEDWLGEKG